MWRASRFWTCTARSHGYELLFWNGREPTTRAEGDLATRTMLDNTVIFGLEELSHGLPAFVNCTADSLTEEWVQVLPPRMTVLELPAARGTYAEAAGRLPQAEGVGLPSGAGRFHRSAGVQASGRSGRLRQGGYSSRSTPWSASNLLRWLEGSKASAVAQNVETQEQYGQACKEGFELFQGYYFCRPEPLKSHKIPGNRLVHLEILEDLQNDPVDLQRLSQLVMCDASLTYRLLRLVNSPICAMRQEVTSIQSALMLVGESTFRRIAMLAIASDFNADQPAEILRMAFERGRFCELAAGLCGLVPSEQYLIGMVSLFPAMLRILMEDLVRLLPLREKARDALLGRETLEGVLLHWIVCQEHGDWEACDAIIRANGLARRSDHAMPLRGHRMGPRGPQIQY